MILSEISSLALSVLVSPGQSWSVLVSPGQSWSVLVTLSLALPGEDHHAVDLRLRPEVHHEDRLVHVVIVHDGTVGEVTVLLTVDCQGAVSVLPLFPSVSLVVHPGLALEGFIGHTASLGVDSEEAWATVSTVRTPDDAGPQSDPLPPGERMNPDVASHHRHVEIVSPLCPNVHVASKYLNVCVERQK